MNNQVNCFVINREPSQQIAETQNFSEKIESRPLPPEIWLTIFSFLNPNSAQFNSDEKQVSLASHEFRKLSQIAYRDKIKRLMIQGKFGTRTCNHSPANVMKIAATAHFSRWQSELRQLDLTSERDFINGRPKECYSIEQVLKLVGKESRLESLKVDLKEENSLFIEELAQKEVLLEMPPLLQKWKQEAKFCAPLLHLLKEVPHLKELELGCDGLLMVDFLLQAFLSLKNLTHLTLKVPAEPLLGSIEAEEMGYERLFQGNSQEEITAFFSRLKSFRLLEVPEYAAMRLDIEEIIPYMTSLKELAVSLEDSASIAPLLKKCLKNQIALSSLHLSAPYIHPVHLKSLAQFPQLKKLHLEEYEINPLEEPNWEKELKAILSGKEHLRELFLGLVNVANPILSRCLKSCSRLENLTIECQELTVEELLTMIEGKPLSYLKLTKVSIDEDGFKGRYLFTLIKKFTRENPLQDYIEQLKRQVEKGGKKASIFHIEI